MILTEEQDRLVFDMAKTWVSKVYNANYIAIIPEEKYFSYNTDSDSDLADAKCLYRMVVKILKEYNTKIETKMSSLWNLPYKRKWQGYGLLSIKMPIDKFKQYVVENPNATNTERYLYVTQLFELR